jgi:hypothetical protein
MSKIINYLSKLSKINKVIILFSSAIIISLTMTAKVQAESSAELLIFNGKNFDANLIKFKRTDYVGQCPGNVFLQETVKGKFSYPDIPPAENRRVTISNVTKGLDGNPFPYTDREYSRGRYSENFEIKLNPEHKDSAFAVIEGGNNLEFQIKENDKILGKGTFLVNVQVENLGVFKRDRVCESELSCRNEYDSRYDSRSKRGGYTGRLREVCYPVTRCYCR